MKVFLEPTEDDYKTPEFRKRYATHILDSLNSIEEKAMFSNCWDVSIGDLKFESFWPANGLEKVYAMDLEAKVSPYLTKGVLRTEVINLFGDDLKYTNLIKKKDEGAVIYFDYTKGKNNIMAETTLILNLKEHNKMTINTWSNPLYALEKILELSDGLYLETRPFLKTPKPLIEKKVKFLPHKRT